MASRTVNIEHPKTGERYAIALEDFRRGKHYQSAPDAEMQTFEEAGFKITGYENGDAYEPPAPATNKAVGNEG